MRCPCGALIELEPDPDPPSVLPVGDMIYPPRLMAIDCLKCTAEVRFRSFLKDFTLREDWTERSGAGKKSKAITMANNKPNKPNLEALKGRMDSLQELIAFESDALRRFDLIRKAAPDQ